MPRLHCAGCGQILTSDAANASAAVCCPSCGYTNYPDEQRDGGRAQRRDPRPKKLVALLFEAFRRPYPDAKPGEIETGLVVHLSLAKVLPKLCFTAFVALMGLCLFVLTLVFLAKAAGIPANREPVIGSLFVAGMFFVGGSFFFFAGSLGVWVFGGHLRHKVRYVIGKNYLQELVDDDRILVQIPFDNIARVGMGTKVDLNTRHKFIGIELIDMDRQDTIIARQLIPRTQVAYGYDAVICDDYQISLHFIYEQLVARRKRAREAASEAPTARRVARVREDEKADDNPPPPSDWRRPAFLVGLIVLGVALFFCGGCLLPSLWQFKPANNNPGPAIANPAFPRPGPPLAPKGPLTIDQVVQDLGDQNVATRRAALDRLQSLPLDDHRPAVAQKLGELVDSQDIFLCREAIKALGVWGTPNEVPVLLRALERPDVFARFEVLKVIAKFQDERAVSPVVRCFLELRTRHDAKNALREMGPVAEPQVLALIDNPEPGIRPEVCQVLNAIGTERSVPALKALENDFFAGLEARAALTAIANRAKK